MYYEEYEVGRVYDLEPVKFTEEEIISFASEWDPRWFHIDKDEAKKSRFGGLIASGHHTFIKCWSVWVKTGLDHKGLICGMSIDGLKWLKPVYPEDILTGKITITGKSKREGTNKGKVELELSVKNQRGEEVLIARVTSLVFSEKGGITKSF